MLSWQVGQVKITRVVEMGLPVPARVIPPATPGELRKLPWLHPHFVSEDDKTLKLSVHALLVEAPGLKLVVDTCIGNDRQAAIDTRSRLFAEWADQPILVIGTHFTAPTAGYIHRDGQAFGHVA